MEYIHFALGVEYNENFPGGSDGEESAWNAGDPGSILGWKRPPGDGNGNLLHNE